MIKKKIGILLVLTLFIFPGCAGGGGGSILSNNFDNNAMLRALVQNFILAAYQDLVNAAEQLSQDAESFCDAPDADSLTKVQDSWKTVQAKLKTVEVLGFGPFMDLQLNSLLDFWPARPDNIENAIANNTDFDQATLELLGVTLRGLPVLEYLLFPSDGDSQKILDSVTTNPNATSRCNLLQAVALDASLNAKALFTAWDPQGGNFSASLSDAGQGSAVYTSSQDAIATLVRNMEGLVELLKDEKIGEPLGNDSGGTPLPDLVESPYSDQSLQNLLDNLTGWQALYTGDYSGASGLGIKDLIASRNPELANTVQTLLDEAIQAVEAIPEPLSDAVVHQPDVVRNAEEKLGALRDAIRGPVYSILGITSVFSDNDGD